MISEELQKKIDRSIKLLQGIGKQYDGVIEVAYSGGKDSDVILQLAKEAGINYEAIYKNTTIDPAGTIAHVKAMGVTIRRPKDTFFHLVAKNGYPSRFYRFCCSKLKEYKINDKVIIGVRKAESTARGNRYNEPTECRWFGTKTEANHVEQIYPILEWTDDDVLQFIKDRNITLAPIYYRGGQIDITQRLGCMCCPLQSEKKRRESFKQYPRMVKAYLRAGQKFLDTHPNSKPAQLYNNSYEWLTRELFYPADTNWQRVVNGIFGKPDFKDFLEKYFGLDLTL